MKQALQPCADQYDAIIKGDIPLSLQVLRSGDYKFSERLNFSAAKEIEITFLSYAANQLGLV